MTSASWTPSCPRARAAGTLSPAARRTLAAGLVAALAVPGLVVLGQPAQAALDTRLYGVATTAVYVVAEGTGATTPVGQALPFGSNAAARQPGNGYLYFFGNTALPAGSPNAGRFPVGRFDISTGVSETLPGTVDASLVRLTFTPDGRLYGMAGDAGLREFDPATGNQIGATTTLTGDAIPAAATSRSPRTAPST